MSSVSVRRGETIHATTPSCVVGVENEVRFTLIGTVFGVASSLFVCLNALYTKKINQVVDGNQWKLTLSL